MSGAPDVPHADAAARRRKQLATVHLARQDLALTEDSYRDLLRRITGQESASTCSAGELGRVIAEFRRVGWGKAKPSVDPQVAKIMVLWRRLRPYLRDRSSGALNSFVRRQTRSAARPDGVADVHWLRGRDANVVIEALKRWLDREEAREQAAAASQTQALADIRAERGLPDDPFAP